MIELPKSSYNRLAGFLIDPTKSIPHSGAVVRRDGISFTVERAAMPTILEVRVRW